MATAAAPVEAGEWNFACPDWKECLREGRSLVPTLPLDRDLASKAVRIFNNLRLPDVSGQPRLRDAAGDWQRDIVAALFGSLMPNGRRMVRRPWVLVPKKNSKTTGAGAIGVTALLMDPVPRQPYYIYGPTQAIAQRGFDQAAGMIRADPVLKDRFLIRDHLKTIFDHVTESTLRVQTFDESVATGVIPKGMIVDEEHILGKKHYASRVMGQLWGGLVSKPDGFMLEITTQSDEVPAGVFKENLDLARAIRDGRVTGLAAQSMLPVLYEFPEEFQADPNRPWEDSSHWHCVLPNLGRSVQIDLLEQDFAAAKEKGEGEIRRWASQHLNIEIGLGLHAARWRGADYWLDACEEGLTLEILLERSEVVTVGIDGGGSDDWFGLAVCGREKETGRWLIWARAWALRSAMAMRKDIASRMADFEKAGDLVLVDMAADIVLQVVALLVTIRASDLLPSELAIGVDPADIGALVDGMKLEGFHSHETDPMTGRVLKLRQIEPIQQGMGLLSAIHTAEFKLHDGELRPAASEMLAWCVSNAKAVQKGNAIVINKEVAGSAKIDPLIAVFCAIKLMENHPMAPAPREVQFFV